MMEEEYGDYCLYSFEATDYDKDKKYIGMFVSFDGKIDFIITRENKIKLSKVSNEPDENGNSIFMKLDKFEKRLFKQRIKDILNAAEVHYCLRKPCSTQDQDYGVSSAKAD